MVGTMKDEYLEHLLTLTELARKLINRLPVGEAGQLEAELVKAEDYITSKRSTSLPPSPVRIVRPAPVKSTLTLEQIQVAVRKVSKKNRNKL